MRPWVSIPPEEGCKIPAISWSSVLLPEPLRPMMPTASPRRIVKLSGWTAWKSR
jgi:hypothetical protein